MGYTLRRDGPSVLKSSFVRIPKTAAGWHKLGPKPLETIAAMVQAEVYWTWCSGPAHPISVRVQGKRAASSCIEMIPSMCCELHKLLPTTFTILFTSCVVLHTWAQELWSMLFWSCRASQLSPISLWSNETISQTKIICNGIKHSRHHSSDSVHTRALLHGTWHQNAPGNCKRSRQKTADVR